MIDTRPLTRSWRLVVAPALAGLLMLVGCPKTSPTDEPTSARAAPFAPVQATFEVQPTTKMAASEALLKLGKEVYARRCAPCHGANGEGDGAAAYLLYPRPRDFKNGTYHFGSTWEGTPTDDDLYVSISRGIPGSAMPSWAHLPEKERWGLVHFVKSLAAEPLEPCLPESDDPTQDRAVIKVPPEPADDEAGRARAAELFKTTCERCHGSSAAGDGPAVAEMVDDKGVPIRPRDLNTGVFKGNHTPEDLYRRILRGIPGTPMPASPHLAGDDAWHLVHWVRSRSSDRLRERAEMKRYTIAVVRVEKLPDHPDAGDWKVAPKTELHLMPLWWRYARPEYLKVQAVHDGEEIAILLVWSDATHDDKVVRTQDFRDAAAIQLAAADSDPPFFAMGERGRAVNIWMWKAERQADLTAFGDIESQYPNIGIDSYPNLEKTPYEQPMRHAATLRSDKTFITAWGAGNIVADPERRSAGESLRAEGFGTLRGEKNDQAELKVMGVYTHGSYRVLLRRALDAKSGTSIELKPGGRALVAFAIWNGSAGDRDGKKSVTIWQDLAIQP